MDDGEQHKKSAWCRASVRVQRTARRTHREHPIKLLVLNGWRAARVGIFGRSRENLRRTTQRAIRSWEQGTMNSEARGRRRKAPSVGPARSCPFPQPRPPFLPPSDAPGDTAAPPTPPCARNQLRCRLTDPCGDHEIVLRCSLLLASTLALHALPAPVPKSCHLKRPCEPVGGAVLPSPPQQGGWAAAASSAALPSDVR